MTNDKIHRSIKHGVRSATKELTLGSTPESYHAPEYCTGCIYQNTQGLKFCDYLNLTGRRRPCPSAYHAGTCSARELVPNENTEKRKAEIALERYSTPTYFSLWLKGRMLEQDWTTYGAARAMRVHIQSVAGWLNGKTPKPKSLEAIASTFGTDIKTLEALTKMGEL